MSTVKRELVVTLAGREVEISVEPPASPESPEARWRVVLYGRTLEVDARAIRPGTWSLLIEGRSHLVDLDPRATGTAVSAALAEAIAKVEDARTRRLARSVAQAPVSGEEILAPIAGKLVKVLVAVGDQVAAGAGVMVVEAMKMENELAAERGGKVASIHKQTGQSVDAGELLVTLV